MPERKWRERYGKNNSDRRQPGIPRPCLRNAGEGRLQDPHGIRLCRGTEAAGGTGRWGHHRVGPASARRGMYGSAGADAGSGYQKPVCHHDRLCAGRVGGQFHEAGSRGLYPQDPAAGQAASEDTRAGTQNGKKAYHTHTGAQKCRIPDHRPAYLTGSPDGYRGADTWRERYGQGTRSRKDTCAEYPAERSVCRDRLRYADTGAGGIRAVRI